MKFTDEEGKVWEWRGEYRDRQVGDWFLGREGTLTQSDVKGWDIGDCPPRAIFHPVPTIHEFGGVKFEDTGERRVAQKGEWYLLTEGPEKGIHFRIADSFGEYTILHPLQGE